MNNTYIYYSPIFDVEDIKIQIQKLKKKSKIVSFNEYIKEKNGNIILYTLGNLPPSEENKYFYNTGNIKIEFDLQLLKYKNIQRALFVNINLKSNSKHYIISNNDINKNDLRCLDKIIRFNIREENENIDFIHFISKELNVDKIMRCINVKFYTGKYPRKITMLFYNNEEVYNKWNEAVKEYNKNINLESI